MSKPVLISQIHVGRPGRDEIFFDFELSAGGDSGGDLVSSSLRAIGCPELLKLIVAYRLKLNQPGRKNINKIELPLGQGHAAMLLRECLLRARGDWQPPYTDIEMCHCRAVPTAVVDEAIVCGARSVAAVSRKTSAGTSCGTCKTDIEETLAYRTRAL